LLGLACGRHCTHIRVVLTIVAARLIIKTSVNGELKLQKCLGLSCGKTMVARFVSCDFWNDKRAIVHNAIALFLQKAWRIRNAYMHGLADIDVADGVVSASMRRGPMALMLGHEWYLYYYYYYYY